VGKPRNKDANLFYRCAIQRLDDALFLLKGERATASVYLAGYAVECILKSLILSASSPGARTGILASFKGAKAHDFEWLRQQYLEGRGASIPFAVAQSFQRVASWSTDMRYQPGSTNFREAVTFIEAAQRILAWAKGRLT
jgi:HEPN domain-containing protein